MENGIQFQVFEELNNFNGIVAFFAALNCQPVYRLEESKSVGSARKIAKFILLTVKNQT